MNKIMITNIIFFSKKSNFISKKNYLFFTFFNRIFVYLKSMPHTLEQFLPHNTMPHLHRWLAGHPCHIKITQNRRSKLGDFRLMPNHSHQITINGNLEPLLFFFILTHEIAHLLAFHKKRNISPHGKEWKEVFGKLLLESIEIYPENLQILLSNFAENPKANFMSSPELVKYFDKEHSENQTYVENLHIGEQFIYQSHTYQVEEKKKKRYLCRNLHNSKRYLFKSCARVEKLNKNDTK